MQEYGLETLRRYMREVKIHIYYRVAQVDVENLLLTKFRQFWQLLGRYCGYLLLRQDCGTSQIQVNRRFSMTTLSTLYGICKTPNMWLTKPLFQFNVSATHITQRQ